MNNQFVRLMSPVYILVLHLHGICTMNITLDVLTKKQIR